MTQFGRGGGASSSPCGWYVIYAHEQPGPSTGTTVGSTAAAGLAVGAEDSYPSVSKGTIHMWSDDSIFACISSITFASLAAILF